MLFGGLTAAVLMVLTEFSTMQTISVGQTSCLQTTVPEKYCETSGHAQHHWALAILGVLTILLAFGAAVGRSKPAAVAVVAVGIVVLGIAYIGDRPTLDDTRDVEVSSELGSYDPNSVKGHAGGAYTLERIAGVLAIVSGGLALVLDAGWLAGASMPRVRRRRPVAEDVDDDEFLEEDAEDEREARRARREAKRGKPEDDA